MITNREPSIKPRRRSFRGFSTYAQRIIADLPEVRHWLEARRRLMVLEAFERLLEGGLSQHGAARALATPITTLIGWQYKYVRGGFPALLPQRGRCGRKPKSGVAAHSRRILPPQLIIALAYER